MHTTDEYDPETHLAVNRHSLQEQMQLSYEQHPSFQFDQRSYSLDAPSLVAFNDAHELLRRYGSGLTSRQFEASRDECLTALRQFYAGLTAQTGDVHERLFLGELLAECTRLVQEELSLFRWKPLVDSLSLQSATARSNSLELPRNRHYFGSLPPETVAAILELGSEDLARFRVAARQGKVRRDDLSVSTGRRVREISRILNRAFAVQGVNDSVSAYMGRRMSVTGLALELSVPQATWWASSYEGLSRVPKTLYAHLDESIVFPKSIVYLSDVDRTTGPTSCYRGAFDALALNPLQALVGRVLANVGNRPGSPLHTLYAKKYHQSMSSEPFRRHFMKLPPEIRFNSHFGWDVFPGSELENSLLQCEHFMLGEAGTYIVFDGARLLHRGGLLERGERIALQVIFSDLNTLARVSRRIKRMFA